MLIKFTFDVHSFKKQILFLIFLMESNTSISYNNVYAKKNIIPNVLLLNLCGTVSSTLRVKKVRGFICVNNQIKIISVASIDITSV